VENQESYLPKLHPAQFLPGVKENDAKESKQYNKNHWY
jgi:hypothetical protein